MRSSHREGRVRRNHEESEHRTAGAQTALVTRATQPTIFRGQGRMLRSGNTEAVPSLDCDRDPGFGRDRRPNIDVFDRRLYRCQQGVAGAEVALISSVQL